MPQDLKILNSVLNVSKAEAQPDAASTPAKPNFSTSFDCNKAASSVEVLICSDSVLAQLDAEMGQSYSQALKSLGNDATLKDDQRRWLASRDSRCGFGNTSTVTRTCLIQMTTARVAQLTALVAAAPPATQTPNKKLLTSLANESVIEKAMPMARPCRSPQAVRRRISNQADPKQRQVT